MKITDEMVEAVARVLANDLVEIGLTSESPVASADGKTMPLWETYLNLAYTALTAALAVQTQQGVEEDLDARMKAAGMYTVAEMMGVTPLTKWKSNPAIKTLDAFSEWLDRKVSEYLTMKAGYDLGDKSTDDELYEWVEAHAAVFGTIRDQFQVVRSALVDVPAVESEPVADPEPIAWYMHLWNEADEDIKSDVRWGQPTLDEIERAEHNGHDIEYLYGSHPPRSLSNEGWMPIETVPHNEEVFLGWFDIDGDWITEVGEGSWGWRGELVNNVTHHGSATHWKPLPTPPSTRKGSSEGDGSATITNGGE